MRKSFAITDAPVGIPDDDIGIRAWQEASFTRVETKDFGRIGARQGDKLVGGELA